METHTHLDLTVMAKGLKGLGRVFRTLTTLDELCVRDLEAK